MSHVCVLCGIWRTTCYPSTYKPTNFHITWKPHHTRRHSNTLWHWFNADADKGNFCMLQHAHQLLGGHWSSPVQLMISWPYTVHIITSSQPEVIEAEAFFLQLFCFSPPPALNTVNNFLWDIDTNRLSPEISCYSSCSNTPSAWFQAGRDIPCGVHGKKASCFPLPHLKSGRIPWVTSSNLSHTSEQE